MRSSRPTQFVRGGQTTQHWTRMATQVVRYSIAVAAFVFSVTFGWFVVQNYELDKVRLTGFYWVAQFNVQQKGNEDRQITYVDLSGQHVTRSAGEIFADADLRDIYQRYNANAARFAKIALIPTGIAFGMVFFVFALVGRSLKNEEHLRGARLVSQRDLKAWSRQKWRAYHRKFGKESKRGPRYTLAGIEFPPNAVEAQIGITGTVGVGKTNAMHELLNTIREAGGRAIIYDRMGGLLRDHYQQQTDVILNPFDARSVGWSPFNEVRSAEGFAQIAEVMIPDQPGANDTFWTQSARLVFQYAARELAKAGETTNDALRRAIMTIPSEELAKIVGPTPGAHFFGQDVARTSASIRANLITELRFLEYLRDDGVPFSIRDWVVNDRPGFVFLTGNAEQSAATRNIVSTLMEVAANALMTCEESRDPKIWFFLDEVPTLNRMPFLPRSLAEIRQFGGAFVVGYQVFSQLEDIYGDKAAETISGVLNNRIVFNTPDFKTAERSSRSLGEEDVIEQQENLTLGAHDTRDGVGIVGRRTQRPIVTPAEIQSLPQFVAYFRPAYDAPTARVKFEPVAIAGDAQTPKLVPYQGGGFDHGMMQEAAQAQEAREGQTPTMGFLSLAPEVQRAEFDQWLARVAPDVLDVVEDKHFADEVDWLWSHFAQARMRDVAVKDVGPPAPPGLSMAPGHKAASGYQKHPFPSRQAIESEHSNMKDPPSSRPSQNAPQDIVKSGVSNKESKILLPAGGPQNAHPADQGLAKKGQNSGFSDTPEVAEVDPSEGPVEVMLTYPDERDSVEDLAQPWSEQPAGYGIVHALASIEAAFGGQTVQPIPQANQASGAATNCKAVSPETPSSPATGLADKLARFRVADGSDDQ